MEIVLAEYYNLRLPTMREISLPPKWVLSEIIISALILYSVTFGKSQVFKRDTLVFPFVRDVYITSIHSQGGIDNYSKTSTPNTKGHYEGKTEPGLKSLFLDAFDWTKKMPDFGIVNTFLDDEDDLPILKELSEMCPRKDFFYGNNPAHMAAAMKIKKLLMEQDSAYDAVLMAASLRDRQEVNPNAWIRGFIGATLFRQDMQSLPKPAIMETMPSMLINWPAIREMKRQSRRAESRRTCVVVDGSKGLDNGVENVLWYFGEDLMLNSHHWYWHLTYPLNTGDPRGDRRGELFYFMHHTFVARYDAERLANGLQPVSPLILERGTVIRQPFNPHLTDSNSGRNWTPRPPNVPIADIMVSEVPGNPTHPRFISVDNRTIHINRILNSIRLRTLLNASLAEIPIDNLQGIDFLGDIVEANGFSINPEYYGYHGVHNTGHDLIGLSVDPRQERGLLPGVFGEPSATMRDPVFYPFHSFIDNIFESHKRTLPPYQLTGGDWPLVWKGVKVKDVGVISQNLPYNHLETFWNERRFDLSRGLDFNRSAVQGPIWACVRHLDHLDFQYQITINRNSQVNDNKATVRIFMAPRYDQNGHRYPLETERRKFFIMDKFTVSLRGVNKIVRNSADTELTIDFPQSYRELQRDSTLQTPQCGCGWPHHLLVPKGTPEGMKFDLFVMVTNARRDAVPSTGRRSGQCRAAPIFCGIVGERYPDARPMGYPWDRQIYAGNSINPFDPNFDTIRGHITLEKWIKYIPNSAMTQVTIRHLEKLKGKTADKVGPPTSPGLDYTQDLPVNPTWVSNLASERLNFLPRAHANFFSSPIGQYSLNSTELFQLLY